MRFPAALAALVARYRGAVVKASPPSLPPLHHVGTLDAADWLRGSLTTFAQSVASFLPGTFEAYARLYHPWEGGDETSAAARPTWRALAAAAAVDPNDPVACASLMWSPQRQFQVDVGSVPRSVIAPLVEHLRAATTTPGQCWFAVWEGFGGSAVPYTLEPRLELPHRGYHVFTGPIEGALISYAAASFVHQSANLWWPADHAWCVATEVDHGWTYVGGARSCIRELLADVRFEAVETTAAARW